MKKLFIVPFLLVSTLHGREIVEHQLDDSFVEKNKFKWSFSHKIIMDEVEHEYETHHIPLKFDYQQTSVGVDYGLDSRRLLRFGVAVNHQFRKIESGTELGDPTLSYWQRLSLDELDSHLTKDLGIEWTTGFLSEDKLKPHSGHRIGLNYRFGFGEKNNRAHGTYTLGYQEGIRSGEVSIDGSFFYGMRFTYEHDLTEKFGLGISLNILRNTVNQNLLFFQDKEESPSWETGGTFFANYLVQSDLKLRLAYTTENETSGFYRSKNPGDIDRESKAISLALIWE